MLSCRQFVGRIAVRIFGFALCPRLLLLPQNRTDAMNVSGQHREGNIALETIDAMIRAAVQAMHFERINGRLNRRVRTPGFDEWQGLPGLLRRLAQLSFSGQRHQFQLLFQSGLIRWSMEALVKAANAQLRKALARLRHYLQRHLIAALLLLKWIRISRQRFKLFAVKENEKI